MGPPFHHVVLIALRWHAPGPALDRPADRHEDGHDRSHAVREHVEAKRQRAEDGAWGRRSADEPVERGASDPVAVARRRFEPNIPFGNPNLTDQQVFDVAAYINAQPRPDYPGKENDWPKGNPPPDVAYPTKAGPVPPSVDSTDR